MSLPPQSPPSGGLAREVGRERQLEANAYVLGTDPVELERLGFQHQLWSDAAHTLWRKAKIAPGQCVLDIGCGPGFATTELASMVTQGRLSRTRAGEVVAIDQSAIYVGYLRELARAQGLNNITVVEGDVQELGTLLPTRHASFDLAWARWVFCFLKDPLALVKGAHTLLRPGGYFAVHDYFNYGAMTAMPRRPGLDRAVAATIASWRDHGGNADVAGLLPRLFHNNGFEIVHVEVHQRIARADDTMLHWLLTWWRGWGPKLVETGYLSAAEQDTLQHELNEIAASPTDYCLPPPVTEILVRKRS